MAHPTHDHPPEPPRPPDLERRIDLRSPHVIGLAVLLTIVVLAMAGVFDVRERIIEERIGAHAVVISYPSQLRYHMAGTIELTIRGSVHSADSVRIGISQEYLAHFEAVSQLTEDPGFVVIGTPPVADERRVRIELTAARAGRARGMLRVEIGNAYAEIPLRTFIYP